PHPLWGHFLKKNIKERCVEKSFKKDLYIKKEFLMLVLILYLLFNIQYLPAPQKGAGFFLNFF
ncbi:MAG: hypothetical protein ACOC5T_08210, partial [Elusimicrobiota bacterium]